MDAGSILFTEGAEVRVEVLHCLKLGASVTKCRVETESATRLSASKAFGVLVRAISILNLAF
jgi:hypothetical protein